MLGLMQEWPLTVDKIIDHAARWHGAREVCSRTPDGQIVRTDYAHLNERARRLSNALRELGVCEGSRVATLAWNTARHLEAWYAIMGMGAVCHTLNPRLPAAQLSWIANHAGDEVVLVDADLAPLLERILPEVRSVKHVIVMGEGSAFPETFLDLERLIEASEPMADWGRFGENQACGLCYTSGTTGRPKGVLYSHRSNFLHALVTLQQDVFGLSARDAVLPVVPMFHANSWGLAFSAPAVGAKLVLPGPKLDGASLHDLIMSEGVTFAAGVPTVWHGLLSHVESTRSTLGRLRRVVIGGSACPPAMIQRFGEYGVADRMSSAWVKFADKGDPNTELLPEWRPYSTERRETMVINNPLQRLVSDPNRAFRELWKDLAAKRAAHT